MNEELSLAIKEIRLRSVERPWFIPVKVSPCEIPDRDIGDGRRLSDFQCIDLYADWDSGTEQIISKIQPMPLELKYRIDLLRSSYNGDRRFAAEKLYRTPDQRAVLALLKALYDPDVGVSYYAVKALGRIRHPRATSALVNALDNPDWRGDADQLVEVLQSIDNEECRKAIIAYREREMKIRKLNKL